MNNTTLIYVGYLVLQSAVLLAAPPSTDPSMDSILGFSKKPPTSQPASATQPGVLKSAEDDDQARPGELILSDGKTLAGKIASTVDKPIRIWVEKEKAYEDVPFDQITSIQATVVWERDEKEWNFKETGSDVKVYSGKTYPARQTQYKFTLTDGSVIEGDVAAPLYFTSGDGKSTTYVLYKRDKGKIGQKLSDLVYVKSVQFK